MRKTLGGACRTAWAAAACAGRLRLCISQLSQLPQLLTLLALLGALVALPPLALASAWPPAEIRFIPAPTGDAVPDGVVTALAQDEQGYIWAGGPTGLARFDGYRFQRFGLRSDAASSEKMGFVTAIVPAGPRRLWAGLVTVGLAEVDSASGYARFYQHDPAKPDSLTQGVVRALARDAQGGLWIATSGGGIDYLAPRSQQFRHWRGTAAGLPSDWMFALLVDRHARRAAALQRCSSDKRHDTASSAE